MEIKSGTVGRVEKEIEKWNIHIARVVGPKTSHLHSDVEMKK